MPNWNENHVDITGNKEDVRRFIEMVTDKFDYNRVIPMPEELQNTQSPTKILTQAEYEEQEKLNKKMADEGKAEDMFLEQGITEQMQQDFISRFGCDNWYDWSIANWGVKWNTAPENVNFDDGDTWARWEFLSPWGPPELVCQELRELFPNVDITWFYQEPGMQMSGWL